jgi:putative ABC transport system permease protein
LHDAISYADENFFAVFPLPAIAGDLRTALSAPDSIVLTRYMARKFFGEDAPLGKTLEVDRKHTLRVTAVLEDLPSSTHFKFRLLAGPQSPTSVLNGNHKQGEGAYTYFRLVRGTDFTQVQRQLRAYIETHRKPVPGIRFSLEVAPIADIHLLPAGLGPQKPPGDPNVIRAVILVGVLILIIAGFNFVSLMTARATQRAVEVGVRKLAGASRRDLMLQFVGEAIIYMAFGVLVAMAIVELSMPAFNVLLDRSLGKYTAPSIAFDYWRDPWLAFGLVGAILVFGAAAGIYPALILSAFRPAAVLKPGPLRAGGSFSVRQFLVVAQFAILVILILAAVVIQRQTAFALHEGLRIDHDQVLLIFFRDAKVRRTFQSALAELPGVQAVTSSHSAPTNFGNIVVLVRPPAGEETTLRLSPVDFGFHEFYALPLLAGRFLSPERGTDSIGSLGTEAEQVMPTSVSVLVNESAARQLGYSSPQQAIGKSIAFKSWPPQIAVPIVGVVPDFPVDSVRVPIQPTIYIVDPRSLIIISARLTGRNIPETLAQIDKLWQQIGEPRAIPRQFLDEYYDYIYTDIRQQGKLFAVACAVAVVIACLGLFGLSVFSAHQRTKEIGIRKAMGADSGAVLGLLLWAFAKPVLCANLIAWPIAFLALQRWLEGFAYRVELEWWLFPAASLIALIIALLTVSAHSYMVSRAKPVRALRYE